ncbi:hypothetical protein ACMD2_20203 [Ananas comosus]|uniref:Uncharacterized protein n=1 Tax=Ananas comosus TaxID=4615 RepID=A0A199UKQ8_ANACO|nr:hypothetical protein ACMD2_20203 [Ananas comosus]
MIITPSTSSQQAPQDPLLVDRIVADAAVRSYRTKHRKTAVTFGFLLPPTLSGVSAEAARYRAGSLRRYGATIGEFSVPPGIVAHPHVKRLLVVSQNLGNLSSLYSSHANVAGFEIVSPVLGLLFYNAAVAPRNSSAKIIRILVAENPVRVNFSANTMARRSFCAGFELDGNVRITDRTASGVCEARVQGHFAVVVIGGGGGGGERIKAGGWKVVVMAAVAGAGGAGLIGLLVVALASARRKRNRMAEMERRAYEDEALRISMVGHVRAPTAGMARTAPVLEHDEYSPS